MLIYFWPNVNDIHSYDKYVCVYNLAFNEKHLKTVFWCRAYSFIPHLDSKFIEINMIYVGICDRNQLRLYINQNAVGTDVRRNASDDIHDSNSQV